MAILDYQIQSKIDELSGEAYKKLKEGMPLLCFQLYEKAWNTYPEPKYNWNEAYNTARYAADDCFSIHDMEECTKWINKMILVNNHLHQSDEELSFYLGKYFYETENYDKSYQKFKTAIEIAGYRCFENEDPKYLDFYKHPEKFIKKDKRNDE